MTHRCETPLFLPSVICSASSNLDGTIQHSDQLQDFLETVEGFIFTYNVISIEGREYRLVVLPIGWTCDLHSTALFTLDTIRSFSITRILTDMCINDHRGCLRLVATQNKVGQSFLHMMPRFVPDCEDGVSVIQDILYNRNILTLERRDDNFVETWLDSRYPEWRDPTAYWDYE